MTDHHAERDRERRERREAREAAERRHDELKKAWRQRRTDDEREKDRRGRPA